MNKNIYFHWFLTGKPGAPGIYNLRTKEYGPTILVKWNPPADDGFDSDLVYKVYWRPKKDPAVNWKVSADLKKTTLEFEVPDEFQPGSFEFKVTATNKAGESRPDVRVVEIMIKESKASHCLLFYYFTHFYFRWKLKLLILINLFTLFNIRNYFLTSKNANFNVLRTLKRDCDQIWPISDHNLLILFLK